MRRLVLFSACAFLLVGCGLGPLPRAQPSVHQALTQTAELLEFESISVRTQLLKDAIRLSALPAEPATQPLFPIIRGDQVESAPALDSNADLLQVPDAGAKWLLKFDGSAYGRQWPFSEDRREAYQGLSEREVADLVARKLLETWKVDASLSIVVERAPGAPYAAAFVDGVLRVNPAFLYMAAANRAP
jgi:hypothetical protein